MQVSRLCICSRRTLNTQSVSSSKARISRYLQSDSYTSGAAGYATMASATTFYDFKPNDKKGKPYPLTNLKGKVVLVVNTASKCGFTPQFEGMERLYKGMLLSYHHHHPHHPPPPLLLQSTNVSQNAELKPSHPDFEMLGFPCNQFGSQDPGTDDEIQSFCQVNYGVTFPVLGKTEVNGPNAEPVYEWMKQSRPGILGLQRIKWNFEKFLIGRDGLVKQRWASTSTPASVKSAIEEELKKGKSTPTKAEKPTPTTS